MPINRLSAMAMLLVASLSVVAAGPAAACEKHLNGHQSSSDTAPESIKK